MLALLALAATLAADDSLMAPGVSQALARYRAAHLRDVRYELTLDVTRRDTAYGRVRVHFARVNGGDVILDFRGHAVVIERLNGGTAGAVENNGAHLRIAAASLRDGANTLELNFRSPIAPSGASIIRFTDDTDKRDYLYTLLVPSDANLLFPCFDQPDIKAVFELALTTPKGWSALSNGALTERRDDGTASFRFAPTQPLSTYFFAFAAGPWSVLRSSSASSAVTPIDLWVRPSRAREVETDTLIALNRRARDWLATYFGIPYPFEKLDMLLAPAFPFGGMEHPGAIFYNEESFIYREPPTLIQKFARQATVNHEVAHQWFGDYTTMRWFDDLWLKEGFSTYMAAKMQAATGDPSAWMSFYLRNKPSAYDVDASLGTTPVWQELANLDQAKSNYGPIVYNKAPGVLKQLDHLVGEQAFRAGVHDFLAAHPYGNATWQDLLVAIGSAANRDLTDWGRAYFLRAGMPIVEQQLEVADGRIRRLALIQRPAQPLSGKGVWPMKVEVHLSYDGRYPVHLPVEMRAETTVVAEAAGMPAPMFVYPNANDYGYGLFMLDPASRDWLLSTNVRVYDAFLRAMLWGSLWDLVREARLDPARYVDAALAALAAEQDEQIAARLVSRVVRSLSGFLPAGGATLGRRRAAESLFLARARDTTLAYGLRKNFFDSFVSLARSPESLARLESWLDSASAAGMPLRQPSRWSIVTTLVARGVPTAESRLAAEMSRDTTTGGKRRAFVAGAALTRPEVKRAYFDRYLRDSALNEEWVTASLGAFNAQEHWAMTLPYLRPALDTLPWVQKNRRIFFLGSWLGAFIGGQGSPEALAVVDRYLAEHPDLPRDLRLKVLQARDDLERTVRIRAAFPGAR